MTFLVETNKKNFGHYLRKLRETTCPNLYGFKTLTKRRTPGLRREELAQLCNVSPTWITLLEQGRASPTSLKLIQIIITQLKLNQTQKDYFLDLYVKAFNSNEKTLFSDDFLGVGSVMDKSERTEILTSLVNSFIHPAYIIDPKWDMVCWNESISNLFNGWLNNINFFCADKNLLNFIFLDEISKANLPDWEYRAKRSVAEFRNDSASFIHLPLIMNHIDNLLINSPYFKKLWETQEVLHREGVVKSFRQANGELIFYRQISNKIEAFPALRLILLLPKS